MSRIITLTPNPTYDFAVDADFVEPNRKLRCKNPEVHPGGGGINVARAATRLGADVLAIFTTGGLYGEALKKVVSEEKVRMRTIPVKGETRLAFHVRELKDGDEYRFNLPGAVMSEDEVKSMLDALTQEARAGDYVVGSGSLPGGEPADFWASAARVAKAAGARFVLDSIHGLDAAVAEGVFMLRHNQFEYPALAGRKLEWPGEIAAFAEDMARKGAAERMVITHGGDGSVMATREKTVTTPVLEAGMHSAVGAGDSFVAALTVALMRGESDKNALRYASAAAAATRMRPGTALFKAEDVERLYAG